MTIIITILVPVLCLTSVIASTITTTNSGLEDGLVAPTGNASSIQDFAHKKGNNRPTFHPISEADKDVVNQCECASFGCFGCGLAVLGEPCTSETFEDDCYPGDAVKPGITIYCSMLCFLIGTLYNMPI